MSKKSQHAGSSTAPKDPQPLSKETIDSSEDEGIESGADGASSIDSEMNIDDIEPRKRREGDRNGSSQAGPSHEHYRPPAGMKEITVNQNFATDPFEFDNLAKNPRLQLWAIRVPVDVKPSRLSNLSVKISAGPDGEPSGSVKLKQGRYTLRSSDGGKSKAIMSMDSLQNKHAADVMHTGQEKHAGAEEMNSGLRLLVPSCKRKGKLFVSPIPISHHLILTPEMEEDTNVSLEKDEHEVPSFLSSGNLSNDANGATIAPKKRTQPSHLFKFRNAAYGYSTPGPSETITDEIMATPEPRVSKKHKSSGTPKDSERKKKRKATTT